MPPRTLARRRPPATANCGPRTLVRWVHGARAYATPDPSLHATLGAAIENGLHIEETTMTVNPYLSGNFAPVDDEVAREVDSRVTGTIPRELNGRLLRIGPNPDRAAGPRDVPLVHRQRHGARPAACATGAPSGTATASCATTTVAAARGWPPDAGPAPRHGRRRREHQRDRPRGPDLRDRRGRQAAGRARPTSSRRVAYSTSTARCPARFTAHPKRDPDTGELHAVVYYWACGPSSSTWWSATDGRVRRRPSTCPCPASRWCTTARSPSAMSCSSTCPCTFDVDVAMAGAFPYRWNPDYGARVGLLPREGDASQVRWCEVDRSVTCSTR